MKRYLLYLFSQKYDVLIAIFLFVSICICKEKCYKKGIKINEKLANSFPFFPVGRYICCFFPVSVSAVPVTARNYQGGAARPILTADLAALGIGRFCIRLVVSCPRHLRERGAQWSAMPWCCSRQPKRSYCSCRHTRGAAAGRGSSFWKANARCSQQRQYGTVRRNILINSVTIFP